MTRALTWLIVAAVVALAVWRRTRRADRRTATDAGAGLDVAWPRMHGDISLIAAREVRQRVRGRLFKGVTLVMLAGVAAAIVIPAMTKGGRSVTHVGVVGELSSHQRAVLIATGAAVDTTVRLKAEPSEAAARSDLLSGHVSLAVVDGRRLLTKKTVSADDISTTATLVRSVAAVLGRELSYQKAGLSDAQAAEVAVARPVPIVALQQSKDNGTVRGASVVGVIVLFILLTQYNTWTMTGVMEEKASRVVEVLLAAVRPIQLLTGKLLGIGLLVLAQAGLVVAEALIVSAAVGSDLLSGSGPGMLVSTLVWLILGYAFYSWVYAAAGSLAERQDQIQSIALPIMLPMIVGYVSAIVVASSGTSSAFFDVLAYLPPTAPFVMPVLVGLGDASWWQVTISVVISLASTIAVARVAAGIYRRSVLRTGRRVSLREAFSRRSA